MSTEYGGITATHIADVRLYITQNVKVHSEILTRLLGFTDTIQLFFTFRWFQENGNTISIVQQLCMLWLME